MRGLRPLHDGPRRQRRHGHWRLGRGGRHCAALLHIILPPGHLCLLGDKRPRITAQWIQHGPLLLLVLLVSAHPERPIVHQARRALALLLGRRLALLLMLLVFLRHQKLPHVRLLPVLPHMRLLLLLLPHVLSGVLLRLLSKARLACSRRQGAWQWMAR